MIQFQPYFMKMRSIMIYVDQFHTKNTMIHVKSKYATYVR